jgi:hypothetical protein
MEERNLSMQDALKLNTELLSGPQGAEEEFAGLPEVADRYIDTLAKGRRTSTIRDLETRV